MPSQSDRKEDLEFELVDRPGEKFAVPWVNVADIRFFEKLVLDEVDAKVKEGRFDEAQPYFLYLEAKHPKLPGLKESVETFLYNQVGAAFRAQRYDEALALLVELYARNPARQGASTAYERVTAELVKQHMAAGRYAAARGLLRNLGDRYPATKTTTVASYENQLSEQAQALFAQATAAKAASKPREAHEAVQKAIALWPTLAGASELARSLHQDYPVIGVGVISPLAGPPSQRIDDWAAIRTSHLLAPPIVEPSADGAAYQSPLGELTARRRSAAAHAEAQGRHPVVRPAAQVDRAKTSPAASWPRPIRSTVNTIRSGPDCSAVSACAVRGAHRPAPPAASARGLARPANLVGRGAGDVRALSARKPGRRFGPLRPPERILCCRGHSGRRNRRADLSRFDGRVCGLSPAARSA